MLVVAEAQVKVVDYCPVDMETTATWAKFEAKVLILRHLARVGWVRVCRNTKQANINEERSLYIFCCLTKNFE